MLATLFYFILALLLLICIHEYGHFIVARMCGVKVLRFSFGFGRVLFSYRGKKGTEYAWSMWPLGGYVKMLDETEDEVAEEERHLAFNNQSVWKRILIVLAGPAFNFMFAFFALWLVAVIGVYSLAPLVESVRPDSIADRAGFQSRDEIIAIDQQSVRSWRDLQFALIPHIGGDENLTVTVQNIDGNIQRSLQMPLADWVLDTKNPNLLESLGIEPMLPSLPPIIGKVLEDSPGQTAGLRVGDRIVSVDDTMVDDWMTLVEYVRDRPEQLIVLKINRDETLFSIQLKTAKHSSMGQNTGFIGLLAKKSDWPQKWLRLHQEGPVEAISSAAYKTWQLSLTTLRFIGRLISGKLSLKTVSGPIGIAQGAGESGQSGIAYYLAFLALVSISLGVLNLLPIPMLDGGHLLFYVIEIIKGKPVSDTLRMAFTYAGLIALMGLMFLALGNDISRLSS